MNDFQPTSSAIPLDFDPFKAYEDGQTNLISLIDQTTDAIQIFALINENQENLKTKPMVLNDYKIFERRWPSGGEIHSNQLALLFRGETPDRDPVAIKMLYYSAETLSDESLCKTKKERFRDEFNFASVLHDIDNVCTPIEQIWRGMFGFIVFPWVDGNNLTEAIKSLKNHGEQALESVSPYRFLICERTPNYSGIAEFFARFFSNTLHPFHAGGSRIHRDIAPKNLLLTKDQRLVLIDFGLSKDGCSPNITNQGCQPGTSAYQSPYLNLENSSQLLGHLNSNRWSKRLKQLTRDPSFSVHDDIYATTKVLVETLLLRTKPLTSIDVFHLAEKGVATQTNLREDEIIRWNQMPNDLRTIVRNGLRIDPMSRYSTAQEIGDDLRAFCERKPQKKFFKEWRPQNESAQSVLRVIAVLTVSLLLFGLSSWLILNALPNSLLSSSKGISSLREADRQFSEVPRNDLANKTNEREIASELIGLGNAVTLTSEIGVMFTDALHLPSICAVDQVYMNSNQIAPTIALLKKLENVRHVDSIKLTLEEIEQIADCPSLRSLCLRYPPKDLDLKKLLTKRHHLSRLCIEFESGQFAFNLPDLFSLAQIQSLDYFEFQNILVNGKSVSNFGLCKSEKLLKLNGVAVDDELALKIIDKSLFTVDLSNSNISERTLLSLQSVPNLTSLCLDNCKHISNQSIERLAAFPKLTLLSLDGCQIDDRCVEALSRMQGLRNLVVSNTQITDDAVARLRKSLRLAEVVK